MKSACSLFALLTVVASGAAAQVTAPVPSSPPSPNGSSAIEQALIEHACRSQLPGIASVDAYQDCLRTQLRSLRADFGRDLGRVSPVDRKTLDAACTKARAAEGRQAYLECLTLQLAAIRNRRNPKKPAAEAAALPATVDELHAAAAARPPSAPSSSLSPVWFIVGVVALVAAIGGAFLAVKSRRVVTRKCRVCGDEVPQAGDLCTKCRHEAAEAARQAAAARAGHERAQGEEQNRQTEGKEALRLRLAREEEEARLRQEAEALELEEETRRREKEEEESRQRSRAAAVDSEDVFDPYVVLGVPRDAAREAIDAACQQARLKYSQEQVAHLGPELQEHYRRKAEMVERAYQSLTE